MENKNTNGQGFAIASLIIGIFAFLIASIPCVNFLTIPVGAAAIIFGIVALSKANNEKQPKGMGIAGITLGGLSIFIAIFMWVFIVSSKAVFKDKFHHFYEWAEDLEDLDTDIEIEFENTESLENLEKALDELEGTMDEVNDEVNEAVKDVHEEVKEAIHEAKEEIKEVKNKKKEEIE